MKKIRSKDEIAATRAARKQGLIYLGIGGVVGLIMLWLATEFMLMNTIVLAALAISGGMTAARAAMLYRRESASSAGSIGGMWAAFGFAIPFMAYFFYRFITLTDADAIARINAMPPDQQAAFRNGGFMLGPELITGEYVSYIFYYFLTAIILGWLLGILGGALAKRRFAAA